MDAKFRMEGLEELGKVLDMLPERIQTRVAGSAVRAGANVSCSIVQQAAPQDAKLPRSKASQKYGSLSANIEVQALKPKHKGERGYKVTTGDAFWGHFLEFGTIKMAARPWFRPAFTSSISVAFDKIRDILLKGLDREANKLAGDYSKVRKTLGVQ
jgi:HK97 gp10 family phage protein